MCSQAGEVERGSSRWDTAALHAKPGDRRAGVAGFAAGSAHSARACVPDISLHLLQPLHQRHQRLRLLPCRRLQLLQRHAQVAARHAAPHRHLIQLRQCGVGGTVSWCMMQASEASSSCAGARHAMPARAGRAGPAPALACLARELLHALRLLPHRRLGTQQARNRLGARAHRRRTARMPGAGGAGQSWGTSIAGIAAPAASSAACWPGITSAAMQAAAMKELTCWGPARRADGPALAPPPAVASATGCQAPPSCQ